MLHVFLSVMHSYNSCGCIISTGFDSALVLPHICPQNEPLSSPRFRLSSFVFETASSVSCHHICLLPVFHTFHLSESCYLSPCYHFWLNVLHLAAFLNFWLLQVCGKRSLTHISHDLNVPLYLKFMGSGAPGLASHENANKCFVIKLLFKHPFCSTLKLY